MPDVPASQILSEKFDITARPGQKAICPFCGKQTFAIKRDDTIGKCFHPNCVRYVTAAQFADTYPNSL